MTENVLKTIARPESEEEATADRMILHSARIASFAQAEAEEVGKVFFASDLDDPEHRARTRAWVDAISRYITAVQVPMLLDAIQKRDPEHAEKLARKLWWDVEMGDGFDEALWELYESRGIDPEAIATAVAAHRAQRAQR